MPLDAITEHAEINIFLGHDPNPTRIAFIVYNGKCIPTNSDFFSSTVCENLPQMPSDVTTEHPEIKIFLWHAPNPSRIASICNLFLIMEVLYPQTVIF